MKIEVANPFNITKAVDFSATQINTYFVDFPEASYRDVLKPTSPMPMFVVGGKGSGKTHLLRYFSYEAQVQRAANLFDAIVDDRFIGLYFRCSGLNTERFSGKGQAEDAWRAVFEYYMELWLGQTIVDTLADLVARDQRLGDIPSAVVSIVRSEVRTDAAKEVSTLEDASQLLRRLRADVDFAVNNSAVSRTLNVLITVTRGALVFGIPKALAERVAIWRDVAILYLIDEFENLDLPQQMYINTLVREREAPACIKIGVRRYGLRTHRTYSGGEENRQDSEYELLDLDQQHRSTSQYEKFAKRLVGSRLLEARLNGGAAAAEDVAEWASGCFDAVSKGAGYDELSQFVVKKYRGRERPYFSKLRTQLLRFRSQAPGVSSEQVIDTILDALRADDAPYTEKVNTFLLYRAWSKKTNLAEAAADIAVATATLLTTGQSAVHAKAIDHFGADLFAQLLRDCRQPQRYVGLPTFIDMSSGFPRSLLVTMKNIVNWSRFNGETPFTAGKISEQSQEAGVREASDWFLRDAGTASLESVHVKSSIERLATLFREIRFANKPTECSVIAFSADDAVLTPSARQTISTALDWSLLIGDAERRDKNSMRVDRQYQLNRMVCPRWDLPIYLRATLALTADMVNAIFDSEMCAGFRGILAAYVGRMNAPFNHTTRAPEAREQAIIDFAGDA